MPVCFFVACLSFGWSGFAITVASFMVACFVLLCCDLVFGVGRGLLLCLFRYLHLFWWVDGFCFILLYDWLTGRFGLFCLVIGFIVLVAAVFCVVLWVFVVEALFVIVCVLYK